MIVDGVLYGDDERVGRWVQRKLGNETLPRDYVAVGLVVEGRVRGGVVWHSRKPRDITAAVYVSDVRCGHPVIMTRVLAYPFIQLGLDRVTSEIAASNLRSIRNAKRLGFVEEGCKRGAASDGGSELIMGLYRDNYLFKDKLRALEIEWEAHLARRSQSIPAPQPRHNGTATLQPVVLTPSLKTPTRLGQPAP